MFISVYTKRKHIRPTWLISLALVENIALVGNISLLKINNCVIYEMASKSRITRSSVSTKLSEYLGGPKK